MVFVDLKAVLVSLHCRLDVFAIFIAFAHEKVSAGLRIIFFATRILVLEVYALIKGVGCRIPLLLEIQDLAFQEIGISKLWVQFDRAVE